MELTIFTPTYNRVNLLRELYKSLTRQTEKNFIWLIVDDGSTDDTEKYIRSLIPEAPFQIEYAKQQNQGKHAAHNQGVALCHTELFVCVDSDDTLTEDAVQEILRVHRVVRSEDLLGYYFRKIDTNGQISGGAFTPHSPYVGLCDIYHKEQFHGELVIVFRTELIRPYAFPIFHGEKFVNERVFYNQLNHIAPMYWVDQVIYQFEYQETGYTNNSAHLVVRNPYGAAADYLSESVYSDSLAERWKFYASFLTVCQVFQLDKKLFEEHKIPFYVKVPAMLLVPRYYKVFCDLKNRNS